jgi:hypothetical protein
MDFREMGRKDVNWTELDHYGFQLWVDVIIILNFWVVKQMKNFLAIS